MILVDANLLVYAHVGSFPQHAAARAWLDERINGTAPVGLPWPSLLGFISNSTPAASSAALKSARMALMRGSSSV